MILFNGTNNEEYIFQYIVFSSDGMVELLYIKISKVNSRKIFINVVIDMIIDKKMLIVFFLGIVSKLFLFLIINVIIAKFKEG